MSEDAYAYKVRTFILKCEHCGKAMMFDETQLKHTAGKDDDEYSAGFSVSYTCEHCGKDNRWQGFR